MTQASLACVSSSSPALQNHPPCPSFPRAFHSAQFVSPNSPRSFARQHDPQPRACCPLSELPLAERMLVSSSLSPNVLRAQGSHVWQMFNQVQDITEDDSSTEGKMTSGSRSHITSSECVGRSPPQGMSLLWCSRWSLLRRTWYFPRRVLRRPVSLPSRLFLSPLNTCPSCPHSLMMSLL